MNRIMMGRTVQLGLEYIRSMILCGSFMLLSILIYYYFINYDYFYIKSVQHSVALRLGIDTVTPDLLKRVSPHGKISYSVALVTNQSGKTTTGKSTLGVLQEHGVAIKTLLVPEHGISKDMVVPSEIKVQQLFQKGKHIEIDKKMLEDVDVIMFDLQDVGVSQTSYIKTLFHLLSAAGKYKKTVVIFDRPNVLGSCMEGICAPRLCTSEYAIEIPMRHGLTMGELASYFNSCVLAVPSRLFVVPMENYNRHASLPSHVITYISPNVKTLDACYGYSFLGLIGEVQPFDIGIGTTKSFQCIALPESIPFVQSKWYELKVLLKKIGIESAFCRYFSQRKKQFCSGLCLRIENVDAFSSFLAAIKIMHFFKKNGITLQFSAQFNEVIGSSLIQDLIEKKISFDVFANEVNRSLKLFFNKVQMFFLYKPIPQVIMV